MPEEYKKKIKCASEDWSLQSSFSVLRPPSHWFPRPQHLTWPACALSIPSPILPWRHFTFNLRLLRAWPHPLWTQTRPIRLRCSLTKTPKGLHSYDSVWHQVRFLSHNNYCSGLGRGLGFVSTKHPLQSIEKSSDFKNGGWENQQ